MQYNFVMKQDNQPISLEVGTDLSKFTVGQLANWLEENKAVHYEPALEPYFIHATVFAYLKLLLIAEERRMMVRPTILSINGNYELVKRRK